MLENGMSKYVKTRAGVHQYGSFVKLKGENFWRRVNSDGTLTKVADGKYGTFDYRKAPKKVRKDTSFRVSLANTVNPSDEYPGFWRGIGLYHKVKKNENKVTDRTYNLYSIGDSISEAAWRKYLGLGYDHNLLPKGVYDDRGGYGDNTVRLPISVEKEIPTDTTFLKNRIKAN
jgi:hypothetical protein